MTCKQTRFQSSTERLLENGNSSNDRRIALFPSMVNGVNIDEMFVDCDSPTLVKVHSSCVFKVNNFIGSICTDGLHIILKLDIIYSVRS